MQRAARQLDGLLGCCKDRYLIVEADPHPDAAPGSTRLAHDLLAPLVQRRFRLSGAPGQRARRLLENRAPEWREGRIGHVLGSPDLAIVAEGATGMRVWEEDETRLVEASRLAEAREEAEKQEQERRVREAEERQQVFFHRLGQPADSEKPRFGFGILGDIAPADGSAVYSAPGSRFAIGVDCIAR